MKMNAVMIKEMAKVKPEVAEKVVALKRQWHTQSVRYEVHSAPWQMYLGEGESVTIYAPNGKSRSTRMVSENTIGAANDGINYHVAEATPGMPEGTWVVTFELFLGKPFIDVHYVGVSQLTVA